MKETVWNQLRNIVSKQTCWTCLKPLQENKIVKSTYIWLFIVPFVAKLLSKIEQDILSIKINGHVYEIDLSLYFNWKILFFSALFFVIGNIVYFFSAPIIIKKYNNYGDFLSKGGSMNELAYYIENNISYENTEKLKHVKSKEIDNQINSYMSFNDVAPYEKDVNKNYFLDIFYHHNYKHKLSRLVCSLFYLLGGIFFSIVLFQNIYWVLIQLT